VSQHNEANNFDLDGVNDPKPSSLGGVVVTPNNFDSEDMLEGMSTLGDDFQ